MYNKLLSLVRFRLEKYDINKIGKIKNIIKLLRQENVIDDEVLLNCKEFSQKILIERYGIKYKKYMKTIKPRKKILYTKDCFIDRLRRYKEKGYQDKLLSEIDNNLNQNKKVVIQNL